MKNHKDIDIIKNMKTIEWLKSEVLGNIADLHKNLVNNEESTKEDLVDSISNVIMETYILAKRLGINYKEVDRNIEESIKLNLIKEHKIERWYGDLSQLLEHIISR